MMTNFQIIITMKEINGVINEAAKVHPAETYVTKEEAAYPIATQAYIWSKEAPPEKI